MKSKGFTIIELLVVISIIGMLSSVIIVAINSARAKGVIGASLTFDQHNYSAYYLDTSVAWDFDSDEGSTVRDQSGNGNDLTLSGTSFVTDTPSGYGKALKVPIGKNALTESSLNKSPSNSFTISLWLKLTTTTLVPVLTNSQDWSGLKTLGNWQLTVHGGNILYYDYWSNNNVRINVQGPTMNFNQWYQILVVCDELSDFFYFYSNAVKVSSKSSGTSNCKFNANNIYLAYPIDTGYPEYSIDNIRIYSKALPLSAIEKLYAIESEKFKALAKEEDVRRIK